MTQRRYQFHFTLTGRSLNTRDYDALMVKAERWVRARVGPRCPPNEATQAATFLIAESLMTTDPKVRNAHKFSAYALIEAYIPSEKTGAQQN